MRRLFGSQGKLPVNVWDFFALETSRRKDGRCLFKENKNLELRWYIFLFKHLYILSQKRTWTRQESRYFRNNFTMHQGKCRRSYILPFLTLFLLVSIVGSVQLNSSDLYLSDKFEITSTQQTRNYYWTITWLAFRLISWNPDLTLTCQCLSEMRPQHPMASLEIC
jgi:hypothetical protein